MGTTTTETCPQCNEPACKGAILFHCPVTGIYHDATDKALAEQRQVQEMTAMMLDPDPFTSEGCRLINEEREQQISKHGWTLELNDVNGADGELVAAALCYVEANSALRGGVFKRLVMERVSTMWPWPGADGSAFKPSEDRVRNLVKAGALIAAEIDRLQRLS